MKILYIFPHPDDESFGPAHVMHKQRREGHEVHLLTLTKGGATKQRFKYDYTIDQMGEVRYQEMLKVEQVLNLSSMTVLDLPDSGFYEMDPREIERVVLEYVRKIKPDVVVTYPVSGISGFFDHLVIHAVVKRVFMESKADESYWKRLAFCTITQEDAATSPLLKLTGSKPDDIDCIVTVDDTDIVAVHKALDCYVTYEEMINRSGIRDLINPAASFEIFQEQHDPPLTDLFAGL